jgi:hypothetical protein
MTNKPQAASEKGMDFNDIPQFPHAHYEIDVFWTYLEEHIQHQTEERVAPLDLEPDFQRAHVWTEAQQVAYVEYALRGGEVGRNLTFNCPGWGRDYRGPYTIVDGKQRLEAVRKFLRNDLRVFGHRYKEFTGKLRTLSHTFKWRVCSLKTRDEVLDLYLGINAGGTPHTAEEITRVQNLKGKSTSKP